MKKCKFLFLLLSFMMVSAAALAQKHTYKGVVIDETGETVIGASVVQKGTSNGAVTDFDGNFTVTVDEGATLVISYIGYKTQELKAADNLRVTLQSDSKLIDEVVVVGYGVQKKSVVTASIAKVNTEDLGKAAPVRVDNALKGLASGVTVTSSSGQPGAASQIRIRGVNSIQASSDPLYIVDGMPIEGGIDYLNPSDIESLEVLKDAASGAIYGARAANGVVLVTTKGGKMGRAHVNYNMSYGWQNPWKHRDVLNNVQYANMINEGLINAGRAPLYANPSSLPNTDWQDLIFNDNAPIQNHEVNVSGASEKLNYYLSMGWFKQEGIIGGNYGQSNYDRLTLRSNTKYNIFDESKERNWLNKLDVQVNISYARTHSTAIAANSAFNSVLGSALALPPILPSTKSGQDALDEIADNATLEDYLPFYTGGADGEIFTTPGRDYNDMGNPLAQLSLPAAKNWSHKFVANFTADLQIWDGLKYHISYGADQSFWGTDSWSRKYYIGNSNFSNKTGASSSSYRGTVWQLENTLSYDKVIGSHTFNVVLGQSAKKTSGAYVSASREDLNSLSHPYIDAALGQAKDGKMGASGGPTDDATLASLFGRISYNYDERYMAQVTVRRDGSSRFGPNHKYATFPSFSLGWNVTNERFMESTRGWLSNTKLRLSWGKNGNEGIGNFKYITLVAAGVNKNYILGADEASVVGSKIDGIANPDLKWEESQQLDLGLDLGFFSNALTFSVDYFKKKTKDMLMYIPIPKYIGEGSPIGNVGEMENWGIEFEASYKFHIADANFRVSGNLSYLKNKLINYGNDTGYANLDSYSTLGTISRAQNGEPFPYFYGFKTAGIFQNQAEIDSYVNANGDLLQPTARPGDVRFADVNGDGVINEDDQTRIGKGMPDWTYGLNITANWRDFDFSCMFQGTIGNDIFDATRRTDIESVNMPTWMLGRWTGEGTSSKYPRFILGDSSNNWRSSDLYITDGSYLRLKNIQLGYTLPQRYTRHAFIDKLRVYVAAENLFTLTKYSGFDPEISSGGTSLGIDYGVYPQSRVWTIGLNLGF